MSSLVLQAETVRRIQAKMALAGIREEDLTERFILGSGSGGQKVNKTSSCVQLLHGPSGIMVRCQQSRSREANRWLARRRLSERVLARLSAKLDERRQVAEKIRRQKRRRSRRQRERMLADKHEHAAKKRLRRSPSLSQDG